MGHSSIEMTMIYVHPTSEAMRSAEDKLGEIYERSQQGIESPTIEAEIKRSASRLSYDNLALAEVENKYKQPNKL